MNEINATEYFKTIEPAGKSILVDVRTEMEFEIEHAENAINIPLDRITPQKIEELKGGKQLFVICKSGTRAKQAVTKCSLEDSATIISGGTDAWITQGGTTIKGKQIMSLERQVRIAAGAIIVICTMLSLSIPGAVYGATFVGAGLIFAGVTDTCGMGLMLAHMPWNKVKTSCPV